jgi:TRAP-type C4-dicarboxylate transport system substrate-binding protein
MKARKMGLGFLSVVLVLVLAGLLIAGCGGKEAAGDKPAEKTIRLKFAHHNPPNALVGVNGKEVWIKEIERRTNGRVKIDLYPSSTLGKAQDAFDLVKSGIADITWGYTAFTPGRFPLTEVVGLPMLGVDTAVKGTKIAWELYNTTPYLKNEFKGVKVLFLHSHDGAPVMSKMPLYTMEDIKGKKLRSPGQPVIPFVQALGASPMAMPAPDTYQAAERGVIDGCVLPWEAIEMLNLQEVFKYAMDANIYVGVFYTIMNQQVWDSLPADIQQIIEEESGLKGAVLFADGGWDSTKKLSTDKFLKAGGTLKTIEPAEAARWREKAKVIWENWAKDMEAKGLPGKAVLAETLKLVEKHTGK